MNKILFPVILVLIVNSALAQKPVITNDSYKSWPELRDYYISDDGRFVLYNVSGEEGADTMVVQAIDGKFQKKVSHVYGGRFIAGGKYISYVSSKGIGILKPGSDSVRFIADASDLHYRKLGKQDIVIYRQQKKLVRANLNTGRDEIISEFDKFWMPDTGNSLVYISSYELVWLNLLTNTKQVIQIGGLPESLNFDKTGNSVAYCVKRNDSYQIRYFKPGMDSSSTIVTNLNEGIEPGYQISQETPDIIVDGSLLGFKLSKSAEKTLPDPLMITTNVDVWSYKDQFIQANQIYHQREKQHQRFAAVFNMRERKVVQLETPDCKLAYTIGRKVALMKNVTNSAEAYWNETQIPSYHLIDMESGERRHVVSGMLGVQMSGDERYITWDNSTTKDIEMFDIASGRMFNLTDTVKKIVSLEHDSMLKFTIAAWGIDDRFVLLYDKFDIWQVNLAGNIQCTNLTSGYGASNKTILRLCLSYDEPTPLKNGASLLIAALNDSSKANGFGKIKLNQRNDIASISLQPYLYYFPGIFVDHPGPPIKAKSSIKYLLSRQSAGEAPNLFVTENFGEYVKLTNIAPQNKYNWMSAELLHWKSQDGSMVAGILYKPENFDSTKVYPLIYHYYESRSNELNRFWMPALPSGDLNIPWYVSNGYLVFVPDIKFRAGHFSDDVVDIITRSMQALKKYSWINFNKLGLQGHSFGGLITNMLVAKTNLFAAAQSSAGLSDMIVEYAGLGFGNESLISMVEVGQTKMGAAPWENPERYSANSVVYTLDKVSTPLLIMHNREDGIVPFSHSVLMFNSLRRLKKPVWLLQYDGEGHSLGGESARLDYCVRQQQFFNHYLKSSLAPSWMMHELPATFKGIYSGLEIDSSSVRTMGHK